MTKTYKLNPKEIEPGLVISFHKYYFEVLYLDKGTSQRWFCKSLETGNTMFIYTNAMEDAYRIPDGRL